MLIAGMSRECDGSQIAPMSGERGVPGIVTSRPTVLTARPQSR